MHFIFGSMVEFPGGRVVWRYIRFDQIQDGRWPPPSKIQMDMLYKDMY